ncbi:MAG: polyamine aminopropyltransferase [Verrucomicrobia bacterium]|nr:polyamine aminopropyltransferase [Verrucomicrobiota bacterium]
METLYEDWQQAIQIDRVIHEEKTLEQDLLIFENSRFGRVLALDGVIQTTEADEFIYHEMMVHVPLLSHDSAKSILIIGGGDGGILREVVRHKIVERIVLVEIDASVIHLSKHYLPTLSNGAFEDPRVEIVIGDGCQYVKESSERFDIILCDSTDPTGPGAVLFTEEFYGDCKRCLSRGGIFVNQNGVPFAQREELQMTYERRLPHFANVGYYLAPIPSYVGGFMAFGYASDDAISPCTLETLKKRLEGVSKEMRYYNPEIHLAAFALPEYVRKVIKTR